MFYNTKKNHRRHPSDRYRESASTPSCIAMLRSIGRRLVPAILMRQAGPECLELAPRQLCPFHLRHRQGSRLTTRPYHTGLGLDSQIGHASRNRTPIASPALPTGRDKPLLREGVSSDALAGDPSPFHFAGPDIRAHLNSRHCTPRVLLKEWA
ncbi:hypothetical protein P171DRAFT_243234 [Karstenula rhodostoma CBS 690.94]|uniref:Uncharacterized protein n=1 Tax=Karstenula rhodostoma CBS 690.94 TaxID=1392251 RepID=A0A9P4PQF4_9PLEO|nr:hypothetical protein P171DRAFT_243234 [Karstenula rhodostoma CBS 690.94]